jgi:serine/threonine protein kinase
MMKSVLALTVRQPSSIHVLSIYSLVKGYIFAAFDTSTGETVAIKFESQSNHFIQLEHEYRMYKSLGSGVVGLPDVKWFGSDERGRLMVMQLLGSSLESLFNLCGRTFSLTTVLFLAIQLVSHCSFFDHTILLGSLFRSLASNTSIRSISFTVTSNQTTS